MLMETKEGREFDSGISRGTGDGGLAHVPSSLEQSEAQPVRQGRVPAAGDGAGGTLGTLGISRAT